MPDEYVAFMGFGPNGSDYNWTPMPGLVTKAQWDARTDITDFMTSDGDPLVDHSGFTSDNGDGTFNINCNDDTEPFNAGMIGMYMGLYGTDGTSSIDYYEIVGITDSDGMYSPNDILIVKDTGVGEGTIDPGENVDIFIGGACTYSNMQTGLDNLSNVTPYYSYADIIIDLRVNGNSSNDPVLLSSNIDFDAIGGRSTYPVKITGSNSNFEKDGTKVTFKADAVMASNGLFDVECQYLFFENLIFDADSKALNCIRGVSGTRYCNSFRDCQFLNATSDGVNITSYESWLFVKCLFKDNGDDGISSTTPKTRLIGCTFKDNNQFGVEVLGADSSVCDCVVSGGQHGILVDNSNCLIKNNTCQGGTGSGFIFNSGRYGNVIVNNTASNYGAWGYYFYDSVFKHVLFSNNHAYNNTTAPGANAAVNLSASQWLALGHGNNIAGDPKFIDSASEDYTPLLMSPLIGAGIDGFIIGAVLAIAGGRLMRERRN